MMNGGPISWKSRRQDKVSLSTSEAEFVAASLAGQEVKNARWSMSPQGAGDGLKNIVEFQVQVKGLVGHNQREYEDKWQGWQNWTDEKLAKKTDEG